MQSNRRYECQQHGHPRGQSVAAKGCYSVNGNAFLPNMNCTRDVKEVKEEVVRLISGHLRVNVSRRARFCVDSLPGLLRGSSAP
jgi:hypothetical protein